MPCDLGSEKIQMEDSAAEAVSLTESFENHDLGSIYLWGTSLPRSIRPLQERAACTTVSFWKFAFTNK